MKATDAVVVIFAIIVAFCAYILGISTPRDSRAGGKITSDSPKALIISAGSQFIGKWQQPGGGRMLIINTDGTAITPETGIWSEEHFRWHTEQGRIVFDGWIQRKGYGFGYSYATLADDKSYITCHDMAGIPGQNLTTLLRVKD